MPYCHCPSKCGLAVVKSDQCSCQGGKGHVCRGPFKKAIAALERGELDNNGVLASVDAVVKFYLNCKWGSDGSFDAASLDADGARLLRYSEVDWAEITGDEWVGGLIAEALSPFTGGACVAIFVVVAQYALVCADWYLPQRSQQPKRVAGSNEARKADACCVVQ